MSNAERVEAVVTRNEDGLYIHLGCLSIELVPGNSDNPGPLGWKDGQDPGIILWESESVTLTEKTFRHGEQKPIGFEKMREREIKQAIKNVNNYTRPDTE